MKIAIILFFTILFFVSFREYGICKKESGKIINSLIASFSMLSVIYLINI